MLAVERKRFVSLFGFLFMAALWTLLSEIVSSPALPSLARILRALRDMVLMGEAWQHISASLTYIISGFLFASVLGFLIGVLISQSKIAEFVLMPIIDSMRPVSALAIFPLLIVLIGIGFWSKTVVIFWTAYPAVILSTINGICQVDRNIVQAGMLDGAGKLTLLVRIVLPLASLDVMTGLRIALGSGWISLVAAEMLGSREGLGYYVMVSSQTFKFPNVYAAILIISFIGLSMNWILNRIQKWIESKFF